ncbi:hypothetical protein GIB67_016611 [Kingdonia uniflora]|uniref:Uncharacterized protein n=1 Tax=Kingdonia uniflora TaxID=39325 RepID=A0A7J7MZ32_9MAGN|nr:hypothetical protein GIB67_016611 [Kingdonia uniflora]
MKRRTKVSRPAARYYFFRHCLWLASIGDDYKVALQCEVMGKWELVMDDDEMGSQSSYRVYDVIILPMVKLFTTQVDLQVKREQVCSRRNRCGCFEGRRSYGNLTFQILSGRFVEDYEILQVGLHGVEGPGNARHSFGNLEMGYRIRIQVGDYWV